MKKKDEQEKIMTRLNALPPIKSPQAKESLYKKIETQLQPEQKQPRSKYATIFPALATIILVVFVVILMQNQLFTDQASETTVSDYAFDMARENRGEADVVEFSEQEDIIMPKSDIDLSQMNPYQTENIPGITGRYIVNATDDLLERHLVTVVGMSDDAMYPVPLTVITAKEHSLDYYNEQLSSFQFPLLGLTGEAFEFGTFTQTQAELVLTIDDLDEMNRSVGSSAQAAIFDQTLRFMFADAYESLVIQDEVGDSVDLGPFGVMDRFDLSPVQGLSYKYLETSTGHKLIVPIERTVNGERFITIDEALVDMQEPVPATDIQSSIPEGVSYTLDLSQEKQVRLSFDQHEVLGDNTTTQEMIEAILITAKSFYFDEVMIMIEGMTEDRVGPYELNKALDVPIGINPLQVIE